MILPSNESFNDERNGVAKLRIRVLHFKRDFFFVKSHNVAHKLLQSLAPVALVLALQLIVVLVVVEGHDVGGVLELLLLLLRQHHHVVVGARVGARWIEIVLEACCCRRGLG